ncbi:MAG: ATP-binding cassette domain-containing protein [Rickettsiales bacterium]|jgi:phospholipid/cholesterol/gamma-HCH transport system ATP-binding protein|nr:ATP-binding cassette domain-containing protein [Rickettsiales bacterium]
MKKETTKTKIKISNLYKSFGKKDILRGVNLEVKEKESLVILGGSGTGKSVLIKTICTLLEADDGDIIVDGQSINHMSWQEKDKLMDKFGYLFQGGALFDSLKIWENVAFRLLNKKVKKDEAKNIAIEKLKIVGLGEHVADLYPSELSGGMQKRVSLARTICTNPEIIFFDEPTTGLDPIMSDVINNLIIKTSKQVKATTITITHDMASAKKIADKIALLYGGKIIWYGGVKEMEKSDDPYLKQFINGQAEGPIRLY